MKRNSFTTIITVAIVFACVWIAVSFAKDATRPTDWFQWRGPNRDGISSEKGWLSAWSKEGPPRLWKGFVGVGFSTVSISDGHAYTMGNMNKTDTVYCLDASTGTEIWKYSYHCVAEGGGHPGTASTPTVDGKRVYTLSRDGDLFCFDTDSGKVIWYKNLPKEFGAKPPDWSLACSPLVYGKKLIVDAGMTFAFDKSTGNLIWKTKQYGGGYSSPIIFPLEGSQRLAVFNSPGLVILNPETGQELCSQPWKTNPDVNAVTPIVSGDKVFISSGYNTGGEVVQISGNNPTVIWQNKNMRNHFNSCVLWEGHLYGFDEDELKCMDFLTGNVKWGQRGLGKSSLMIADGKLIIMSEKGDLVIAKASPERYEELARTKVLTGLCWTVPVLSGGRIYCRNHEGDIVCLDVREKK